MERQCKQCGIEIEKYNTFCSTHCSAVYHATIQKGKPYIKRYCQTCGVEIERKKMSPSRYNIKKYCSEECKKLGFNHNKKLYEKKYCGECNGEIIKKSWESIKTYSRKKFCSNYCRVAYFRRNKIGFWSDNDENFYVFKNDEPEDFQWV